MPSPWRSLPPELRLAVAGHTTTMDRSRRPNSFGYPLIPDLDTTFMNLRADSQGLFERVAREYLLIHIWTCGCGRTDTGNGSLGRHLFNFFGRNRRFPHISNYELDYNLDLSAMEIDLSCDTAANVLSAEGKTVPATCARREVRFPSFPAEPDMMLTLYGFLLSDIAERFNMQVSVRTYHNRSGAQAVKILDDMRKLLCNINVLPTSLLPPGYNLQRFQTGMGKRIIHSKELVLTMEAYLDTMLTVMEQGIGLEQLVPGLLMYDGQLDTENLQDETDLYGWPAWSVTRRYLFEMTLDADCAILQGVGYYMLSRPLEVMEQAHFFVNHDLGLGKLEETLNRIDTIIWTFDLMVSHNRVTPGVRWLASVLYARVIILVAWARLNTLQKSPIVGHNLIVDTPLPANVELECIGDNVDEVFESSAWGTPKSMMLVARRDINRICQWGLSIFPGSSTIQEQLRDWILPLEGHIARVEQANARGVSHAMAVAQLNFQMADPISGHYFFHLKQGEGRVLQHALMESDFWQMD